MLSASNEPSGAYTVSLPKWVSAYKAQDPRRLITEKTGWDVSLANDTSQYLVQPHIGGNQLRGATAWFGGDWSAATQLSSVPVLVHELGQWCAYPDFSIIPKFTGYMQPGNYEIFRDSLAAHGLLGTGQRLRLRLGPVSIAVLQGRDRGQSADAQSERLSTARPARLCRPGDGAGRPAGYVLGLQGLHDSGGVPRVLQRHRAPGRDDAPGIHDNGHVRYTRRDRA